MLKIFLVLAIVFAFKAITTNKLRVSIITMGIFSLISSFCYLLYSAPDVAIAEAVMGCTLSTILYLVAFQKYKIFSIYYIVKNNNGTYINNEIKRRTEIESIIEKFCKNKELEPHVIYTSEDVEHIKSAHEYDLIVVQDGKDLTLFGREDNYLLEGLEDHICFECDANLHFEIEGILEEEVFEEEIL
ncbi:hypothetical protein SH2C18_22390 [Clostridium sediminicola]|uniref:Na(+)/H(+) antiporter subunit B n=1 Tax=Clostridium sediminicola TaxID=3114879 RepID=UPI0031F26272